MKPEIEELLKKFEFVSQEKQPLLFQKYIDENTMAYVDFRKLEFKDKGRRFAKQGDNFDIDPNTILELKMFKEERDKILQSSGVDKREAINADDAGKETNSKIPTTTISPGVKIPPSPTSIYKQLIEDWEIDSAVFYGTSGACKTKLAVFLALEAKSDNKKVLFFDAEKNLRKAEVKALGDSYKFIPTMMGLIKAAENIPQDIDIVFCDSIGYHAYVTFCRADADAKQSKGKDVDQESGAGTNMKGKALLEVGAVSGILKNWAMNNNKIAIMTNQADSPFGKGKDYWPESFADKASHTMKEEMVLIKVKKERGLTRSIIKTNKSRSAGRDVDVAMIDITDNGTTIKYFCKGKEEIKKTLTTEMKFV